MRVSEVYASTQGEGPNVGSTTVFLRFGGCNLRCPGWPCDTQHAIDPRFRTEWAKQDSDTLLVRTVGVAEAAGARIVTLTGGEPFLQVDRELERLVRGLVDRGYTVEAFTNGTLEYPDWAVELVSMIVDFKLPGSGEYSTGYGTRLKNLEKLDQSSIWHSVKFVCKDYEDYETAKKEYFFLPQHHNSLHWYYGRVWDGDITNAQLVENVMNDKLPWKLNVQMHNYVWPANERGR
jgi:7-carboxy-7-deazaguanine synthase